MGNAVAKLVQCRLVGHWEETDVLLTAVQWYAGTALPVVNCNTFVDYFH